MYIIEHDHYEPTDSKFRIQILLSCNSTKHRTQNTNVLTKATSSCKEQKMINKGTVVFRSYGTFVNIGVLHQ